MRKLRVNALLLALAAAATALAAERIPWPDEPPPPPKVDATPRSLPSLFLWLYKNCVSHIDNVRQCRFMPTCGDYARQAIARHGPLLGWLMGCERAIRYHGDTRTYRRTIIGGQTRLVDPVSDNDFWLPPPRTKKPYCSTLGVTQKSMRTRSDRSPIAASSADDHMMKGHR